MSTNPAVLAGSQEYQVQLRKIQDAPDAQTLIRQGEQIRMAHEAHELTDAEADNLRQWYVARRDQIRAQAPQQQAQPPAQTRQATPPPAAPPAGQQRPQQGQDQRPAAGGFWAHLPEPGAPKILTGLVPRKPAAFRRPLEDILFDLRTKVHPQMLETRRQGDQDLTFISWHIRAAHLDVYAPGWSSEVRSVSGIQGMAPAKAIQVQAGEHCAQPTYIKPAQGRQPAMPIVPQVLVYVVMRLTIPAAEGDFWREATGWEDFAESGYGDPFSNASAMALSRCASLFGQGQHLYWTR